VESWPEAVDESAARADWGFESSYEFEAAFRDYLIPTIRARYQGVEPATAAERRER
jgi:hypothetical protein